MSVPVDQPVGPLVEEKEMGKPEVSLKGRYVRLERFTKAHMEQIWELIKNDPDLWTYMLSGPYETKEEYFSLDGFTKSEDPFMYAVVDVETNKAMGNLSLMRFDKANRAAEIGHVLFSKQMQRTKGATEAFYLMMQAAFEHSLNVRRLEWKCNNFNQPSRRAAERLGYTFEGVFRQHFIVKGRNRDTAWFSILDTEWPVIKNAFEIWLNPDNFDQNGQQKKGLVEIRQSLTGEKQ